MKEFKWRLLIIFVIIFGSLGFAYSAPVESKDSQKGIASSISTENKELHQKLKEGCEIDAYFKQGDSKCEIKEAKAWIRYGLCDDCYEAGELSTEYEPCIHDRLFLRSGRWVCKEEFIDEDWYKSTLIEGG